MNQQKAKITFRPVDGQLAAIDIQGEVTAFAEDELMQAYSQSVESGAKAVILNFSGLEYMTSSGIGLLVTLFIRANRQGKQLYAVGLNPHYTRIFELTKLNETIRVFGSEEDAARQVSLA